MVLRSWSRSLEVRVLELGSCSFKVLQAFLSIGCGIFAGSGILRILAVVGYGQLRGFWNARFFVGHG